MTFKKMKEKLDKQNMGTLKKSEVCVIDADGKKIPLILKFDTKGMPYFEYETFTTTKSEAKVEIPKVSFYQQMQNLCDQHNIIRHPFNRRELKGFSLMYCEDKQIAWIQGPAEFDEFCGKLNASNPFPVSTRNFFDRLYETAMNVVESYLNSDRKIQPKINMLPKVDIFLR